MGTKNIDNITNRISSISIKIDENTTVYFAPERVNGQIVAQALFNGQPCKIKKFGSPKDVLVQYYITNSDITAELHRIIMFIDGEL